MNMKRKDGYFARCDARRLRAVDPNDGCTGDVGSGRALRMEGVRT